MSYFDDSDSEKDEKKPLYDSDDEKEKDDDKDEKEDSEYEIEDDESVEDLFNLDENIQTIEPKEKRMVIEEDNEVIGENEDFDVSSDEEDAYMQKFNKKVNKEYIAENHPECIVHNSSEIDSLSCITRDSTNAVIDPHHLTLPILTKYERTRILGQRAKQINEGAIPYVAVPEGVMDGYVIAEIELKAKKIPFIIQRPLPDGTKEFWKVEDLEQIGF
jgi:DNA-directed RNA polymerase subunit K/omega